MRKNILILIGGGHAAGKSTAAELIRKEVESALSLDASSLLIEVVNMTDYESRPSKQNSTSIDGELSNVQLFKPSRFDFDSLQRDLESKLNADENTAQKLIIVHGLYALYNKSICDLSHMKVYIHSDADTRIIRWIRRDVLADHSSKLEDVFELYLNGARQEMTDYIFQTKERADVVMPRGAEANGVSLIVDGLLPHLGLGQTLDHSQESGLRPFKNEQFDNQKGNYYELN